MSKSNVFNTIEKTLIDIFKWSCILDLKLLIKSYNEKYIESFKNLTKLTFSYLKRIKLHQGKKIWFFFQETLKGKHYSNQTFFISLQSSWNINIKNDFSFVNSSYEQKVMAKKEIKDLIFQTVSSFLQSFSWER